MSNYYYGHSDNKILPINVAAQNCYSDEKGYFNYEILYSKLVSGDVLYIDTIDSLGDDSESIIMRWEQIVGDKNVDIVLCDCPAIDTRVHDYNPSEYFIYVLKYMKKYMSRREYNYKKKRKELQAQGIKIAQNAGVQCGRPRRMDQEEFERNYVYLKEQGHSDKEIQNFLEMPKSTYARYKKNMVKKESD